MDLDLTHPALSDLRATARRKIPHFIFEYLDSGTGRELEVHRNRATLDDVLFMPQILPGPVDPDFTTTFMGTEYSRPFGISPVGMAGAMWPGAEKMLARAANKMRIPYGLSTVATQDPETIGPLAGDMGWFQMYVPADPEIRRDMLRRAKKAGFTKLIVTVDVPDDSRRERQRRAKLQLPPKLTPSILMQVMMRPAWALGTLQEGKPRLKLAESYLKASGSRSSLNHAGHVIRGAPDWDTLRAIREEWPDDLLVKGVQCPVEAQKLVKDGVDGIWVSNHSGRQFEAGPGSITQLPVIRAAVGPDYPLLFDSGVIGGLDIMRALALGANFVMMGRAWHYAVCAFQQRGIRHLYHILSDDIKLNMAQIGAHALSDLPDRLMQRPDT